MQAKLSARPSDDRMLALWAAPGLLLTSSSERILRLWNFAEDDNYVIAIEGAPQYDACTASASTHSLGTWRTRKLACAFAE